MKLQPRIIFGLAAIVSAAVLASCSEKLTTEAGCAGVCPDQGGTVENVTLDATTLDTTVASVSGVGTESGLLIAARGDSLDTRAIIRFDTIPARFAPLASDTTTQAVTRVDSAFIAMTVDTSALKLTGSVTIEAYDVDTTVTSDATVADTLTAPLLKLFRPDRLIGSQTYTRAQILDTLRYFISNAAVLDKAKSGKRLRIGLLAKSPSSVQIRVYSVESGAGPHLYYRVSPDTAIHPFLLSPSSKTPVGQSIVAAHLSDYTIIAKSPAPAPPQTLNMGGLPPTRVYMRFDIPKYIVDSSTVVRAALVLTQIPNRTIDPGDSVIVVPALVLAAKAVTDPTKAAQILAEIALNPLRVAVGDSGKKAIELGPAFSFWRGLDAVATPRAIVLRSALEGIIPLQARFFSIEAAPALRPKLLISFIRRSPLGLP
ncbi:MAG: hypothetical protein M3Z17_12415 [Gemmatimonadota bacterium]|nr:hypothetical protein [Gemmatimonadota bacterium]